MLGLLNGIVKRFVRQNLHELSVVTLPSTVVERKRTHQCKSGTPRRKQLAERLQEYFCIRFPVPSVIVEGNNFLWYNVAPSIRNYIRLQILIILSNFTSILIPRILEHQIFYVIISLRLKIYINKESKSNLKEINKVVFFFLQLYRRKSPFDVKRMARCCFFSPPPITLVIFTCFQ